MSCHAEATLAPEKQIQLFSVQFCGLWSVNILNTTYIISPLLRHYHDWQHMDLEVVVHL
jgi:hypothetical protein